MDPLVCALHGTPALVQQGRRLPIGEARGHLMRRLGLRTLELCVDNLQPDYFFDHMAPVRAALMQGLWRALYTQDAACAASALRILGKLGGSSRRALLDAQNYTWNDAANSKKSMLLAAQQPRRDGAPPPQLELVVEVPIAERHIVEGSSTLQTAKRKLENAAEASVGTPKRAHLDSTTMSATSPAATPAVSPAPLVKPTAQTLRLKMPLAELIAVAAAHVRQSVPHASDAVPALASNWADWCAGNGGLAAPATAARLPHASALEICSAVLVRALAMEPATRFFDDATMRAIFDRRLDNYERQKR